MSEVNEMLRYFLFTSRFNRIFPASETLIEQMHEAWDVNSCLIHIKTSSKDDGIIAFTRAAVRTEGMANTRIGNVRFSDKVQMEVIIPIPLEWGLWSEQGTCVPLCSRLKCTWRRERCNFLIIISWHVPVTKQHVVRQQLYINVH